MASRPTEGVGGWHVSFAGKCCYEWAYLPTWFLLPKGAARGEGLGQQAYPGGHEFGWEIDYLQLIHSTSLHYERSHQQSHTDVTATFMPQLSDYRYVNYSSPHLFKVTERPVLLLFFDALRVLPSPQHKLTTFRHHLFPLQWFMFYFIHLQ